MLCAYIQLKVLEDSIFLMIKCAFAHILMANRHNWIREFNGREALFNGGIQEWSNLQSRGFFLKERSIMLYPFFMMRD